MQKLASIFLCLLLGTSAALGADEAMWKRVQRLDPGVRLTVTVNGAAPVERYFVQLSETELVVLNLSKPNLPKRQLLNMTADNAAWMAGTSKTTYRDRNVRIGPEGLFVKDQKVADLAEVVEHLPRDRVSAVQKA